MITTTITVSGVEEVRQACDPRIFSQGLTRSLNEVGRKGKTTSIKAITDIYLIKKKDLAETSTGHSRIKMRAAFRGNDSVLISIEGRSISFAYFGARQITRMAQGVRVTDRKGSRTQKRSRMDQGVTVEIIRGKKTNLGHAFIARVRAGKGENAGFHTGVFTRHDKKRLPIYEKRMITVVSMFQRSHALENIETMVAQEFPVILARNLEWYSNR